MNTAKIFSSIPSQNFITEHIFSLQQEKEGLNYIGGYSF